MNLSTLKATVESYLDSTVATDKFSSMVRMVEERVNAQVRIPSQERKQDYTISA